MASRVLVTGGSGFIGSNLASELAREGYEVVAADLRIDSQRSNLIDFRGELLQMDASLPWSVPGKFDWVFHQAALTDPRHHDDREIVEKNVNGFENCLAFCEKHGAGLVYASTAGLYGNGPIPMKEAQEKKILTAYGESKWKMDQMAEKAIEKSALPTVIGLRYFNVFGPREALKGRPASMIYHLGKQMRETGTARIFTRGEQVRDHIYVNDAVNANFCAMRSKKSGIYNVGSGQGTDFNTLVNMIAEALYISPRIEYFEMPFAADTYQANTVADITLAEKEIGFRARWDLRTAIRDYYRFLGWIS